MIRSNRTARIVLSLVLAVLVAGTGRCLAGSAADSVRKPPASGSKGAPAPAAPDESQPVPISTPTIVAPTLPEAPATGKGRVTLVIDGNRRWCTRPDDRPVKSPETRAGGPRKAGEVVTFGYRFSIAGVSRANPDLALLLFESPVYQTATWLPAGKVGAAAKPRGSSSHEIVPEVGPGRTRNPGMSPSTLVAHWQEINRCASLPPRFEFDLEPGTYDLYLAFDLLMKDGSWMHRSTGYLTDIPVEKTRQTQVDGLIDMGQGNRREVSLEKATLLPKGNAAGASGP
jgi:hypothetical protein